MTRAVETSQPRVVLASSSATRREMLEAVGLQIGFQTPEVDEDAIKRAMLARGAPPADIAVALAEKKALTVAAAYREALVIGADQVLICDGVLFDKPPDMAAARQTLTSLRGRGHELITAVAVARGEEVIWQHRERAALAMRALSDGEIDRYLSQAGNAVLHSVGAYQLEGPGAQLFERVDGDFFTILGLPLLPLLAFLRRHDIVPG